MKKIVRGAKKMKGWPPFIASREFVRYFFDSLSRPKKGGAHQSGFPAPLPRKRYG